MAYPNLNLIANMIITWLWLALIWLLLQGVSLKLYLIEFSRKYLSRVFISEETCNIFCFSLPFLDCYLLLGQHRHCQELWNFAMISRSTGNLVPAYCSFKIQNSVLCKSQYFLLFWYRTSLKVQLTVWILDLEEHSSFVPQYVRNIWL